MQTETLIAEIFNRSLLQEHPPVLIDIGASGEIHPEWKIIAPHCIAIAFDADARDFDAAQSNRGYKKLILINKVLTDMESSETSFYLTRSPYCSSVLEPDLPALEKWKFKSLFEVEKKINLPAAHLKDILTQNRLNGIDWFKTDSQGTDLRLFKSLPEEILRKVIIAEFEPGFIDAYKGEDKIADLLNYMEQMPFWLSDCEVKGTQRISQSAISKYGIDKDKISSRNSACWAEFCYFNNFEQMISERELLTGWIFATVKMQHGFALDLLSKLEGKTETGLYKKMLAHSLSHLIKQEQANQQVSFKSKLKRKLHSVIDKL